MWTPKEVAETMIKAEKFDKNAQRFGVRNGYINGEAHGVQIINNRITGSRDAVRSLLGLNLSLEKNLASMDKAINRRFDFKKSIDKIQSYGILIHSSFIVGYENDTLAIF
jgi:hypothetical protein